jgi:protoporphyrinogen oxidase
MKKINAFDSVETLILGAGIAGMSAAYHLQEQKKEYLLIEKESQPGGIARTRMQNGFYFDCGGHYLHLREAWTRDWVQKLLQDNIFLHERRAFIQAAERIIPYPFQAHLAHLPHPLKEECLEGFKTRPISKTLLFKDWVQATFGSGIAKYFMEPYNKKIMQSHYGRLTTDWIGNHIPKIALEDLQNPKKHSWGYNAEFYYPKQGGIGAFSEALAKPLANLLLNTGVQSIALGELLLDNGSRIRWKNLITSLPLPTLIQKLSFAPSRIKRLAVGLKSVGIVCVNLGIRDHSFEDKDWVYYPEKKFPFYRIGSYSAVAPSMCPNGANALYVELPGNPDFFHWKDEKILDFLLPHLKKLHFISKKQDCHAWLVDRIKTAYVVYDAHRKKAVPEILEWLKSQHIHSIGRFGRWQYSSMEQAILEGAAAAAK